MKVIYIAGPYRADTEYSVKQNILVAENCALYVWRNGGVALCPHKNTAWFGGACDDEVWLKGDIELLSRCDAVWFIAGWEKSSGALQEHIYAEKNNIKLLYSYESVRYFLVD